ncbi:unnamed protein product, partial [Amoebophrya sp. A25]
RSRLELASSFTRAKFPSLLLRVKKKGFGVVTPVAKIRRFLTENTLAAECEYRFLEDLVIVQQCSSRRKCNYDLATGREPPGSDDLTPTSSSKAR